MTRRSGRPGRFGWVALCARGVARGPVRGSRCIGHGRHSRRGGDEFPAHQFPGGHHGRARRRIVVHELEQLRGPERSIGRITTAGVVTTYTDPTILSPGEITAGPDGALWFTDDRTGSYSIGRIDPTTHAVTSYTDPTLASPGDITRRARRRAVVHERRDVRQRGADCRQGLDRAHHDARDDHQLPRREHRVPGPHHCRARRCAVVHQHRRIGCRRRGVDRTDHHERDRHQLHRPEHRLSGPDHGRPGRRLVVHQPRTATRPLLDRTDHHCRRRDELHDPSILLPFGITAGPDGALWFTNFREFDRTDHDRRDRHQLPSDGLPFEPVGRPVCDHRRPGWRVLVHHLG